MNEQDAIERLRAILKGIDQDECGPKEDEGWWETSAGSAFGTRKLTEVEGLIREIFNPAP